MDTSKAQASRLFRLFACAAAKYPGSSLGRFVSGTNPGDREDSPARKLEIEALRKLALGFGSVVVVVPALAAKPGAACRSRRTPNNHRLRLTKR
jgi:hypothetical protein